MSHILAFVLNIILQIFDGFLTYRFLHLGVPEANPLVQGAIAEWGNVWGLIGSKGFACALLALIFALRHKRAALTLKALTVTAAIYGLLSFAGFCELLLQSHR
ncbi:MAG TPA: DUF5658 family protein [Candidatus Binatia bacterium]|jgi:hypothetical protein